MGFLQRAAEVAGGAAFLQPLVDALGGLLVMRAIALRIDKFGLVDDPVDFLVLAGKGHERLQRQLLPLQRVLPLGHRARGMGLDPRAHVPDQRAEQLVLRIEIGIETAERGPGALGYPGDRGLVKTLLAKFQRRRVQQLALGLQPARSARLLVLRLDMFAIFSGHNVTANRI